MLSRSLQQAVLYDGFVGAWLHRDGHSDHGIS
jgi:hypothetical protein